MKLCKFGRAIIGAVNYYIDNGDHHIDEWGLYNDIELLFRQEGWIDGGEADDLRSKIDELEQEIGDLENEIAIL